MNLLDRITEAIEEILKGFIKSGLQDLFTNLNDRVGTITDEVGQTPQQWNSGIFSMIQSLSETVIVPIAGMIITFVLCYELITMITEKNNMHEMETFMIFKWVFKAYVAIYLVTNTFNFSMAVFDMAQSVVSSAGGVVAGSTAIDASATLQEIIDSLENMEVGELFMLAVEVLILTLAVKLMSVAITIILYGRMIEIYLYTSVAPIPFATLTNREWGNIGNNYIKGLFALGFQGFFMMVCVGIYSVLIATMNITSDVHNSLFSIASYTAVLAFTLFKTGSISKSIFNAH